MHFNDDGEECLPSSSSDSHCRLYMIDKDEFLSSSSDSEFQSEQYCDPPNTDDEYNSAKLSSDDINYSEEEPDSDFSDFELYDFEFYSDTSSDSSLDDVILTRATSMPSNTGKLSTSTSTPLRKPKSSTGRVQKPKTKRNSGMSPQRKKQLFYSIVERNRYFARETIGSLLQLTERRSLTDAEVEKFLKAERWIIDKSMYN